MRNAILVAALCLQAGCSSAGPYVTEITPIAPNRLEVWKCSVGHMAFVFGHVYNKSCTREVLDVKEGRIVEKGKAQ